MTLECTNITIHRNILLIKIQIYMNGENIMLWNPFFFLVKKKADKLKINGSIN
jgi:hypothetical protein